MAYDTIMRALRIKHNIPYRELAKISGVTKQRIQFIENSKSPYEKRRLVFIQNAFEGLIEKRKTGIATLQADYEKNKERLLSYEEGDF